MIKVLQCLRLWVILSVLGMPIFLPLAVHGETIYVGSGEAIKTIQAGIDAASDGETVVVRDGIYTGEGNAGFIFKGKAITVRSENGRSHCVIDGQKTRFSIATFSNGEKASSVLSGFTIKNCLNSGIQCVNSSPTISNCIIAGNSSFDTYYEMGGGIFTMDASPTIRNCIISGNISKLGGGISCFRSSPKISNCTISENFAYQSGGGIYIYDGSSPSIVNVVIRRNKAVLAAGGVLSTWVASPSITNCTIVANSNSWGGVIHSSRKSSVRIFNSIIWANKSPATVASSEEGKATINYSDLTGGYGGEGNIDAVPGFDGGYVLASGSPCIDAGDNSTPDLPKYDRNGRPRISPKGGRVDMGAYEFQQNTAK
jgi:parallel beta-helix repeat protein